MSSESEGWHSFVAGMERDFERFYDEGDRLAGTRVREGMQKLKQISPSVQVEGEDVSLEGEDVLEAEVDQRLREALAMVRACRTQIRHAEDVLERVHRRADEISTAYRLGW